MYYKFGGFTQRLVGAGVPAAYSAQVTRILLLSDRRVDLHGFIPLQAEGFPYMCLRGSFLFRCQNAKGGWGMMPYERMPKGSGGARGLLSVGGEVAAAAAAESFLADWLKGETELHFLRVSLWHEEQPTVRATWP